VEQAEAVAVRQVDIRNHHFDVTLFGDPMLGFPDAACREDVIGVCGEYEPQYVSQRVRVADHEHLRQAHSAVHRLPSRLDTRIFL
jgi:hypothetical protein